MFALLRRIISIIAAFIMSLLPFGGEKPETNNYKIENQVLTVNLESNPTTGYSWTAFVKDEAIKQNGESVYTSTSLPEIAGGGGYETFKFTAVRQGEFLIAFYYQRPFESSLPIETSVISGEVTENLEIKVNTFDIIENAN